MLPSRFSNVRPLGKGGFASVVVARDSTLGEVALKSPIDSSVDVLERFTREVELQSELSHPNIVEVLDFDLEPPHPWYAMPMAAGNLAEIAEGASWDDEALLGLFQDVLSGVGHAHTQHVLHRDLKPGNVLVYLEGDSLLAKVSDFGLSRRFTRERMEFQTLTAYAAGTSFYTAPEQWKEFREVTETADVYSLGRILESLVSVRASLVDSFPHIRDCIRVATRSEPTERYQTVEQLAVAIGLASAKNFSTTPSRQGLLLAASDFMAEPDNSIAIDRLMDALEKLGPESGEFGVALARVPEEAVRALCVKHPGRLRSLLLELLGSEGAPEPIDAALRARNFLDECAECSVDPALGATAIYGLLRLASIYGMQEFVDVAVHRAYSIVDPSVTNALRSLLAKNTDVRHWVLAHLDASRTNIEFEDS